MRQTRLGVTQLAALFTLCMLVAVRRLPPEEDQQPTAYSKHSLAKQLSARETCALLWHDVRLAPNIAAALSAPQRQRCVFGFGSGISSGYARASSAS